MARRPDMMFGPLGNVVYDISPEFSQFLIRQNKYQMNLSLWKQYIIWKYTVASEPITRFLLQIQKDAEKIANRWTLHFFEAYDVDFYGKKNIGTSFRKWLKYFENPRKFAALESPKKFQISKEIIEQFQRELRRIISNTPKTATDFYVYKASRLYTGIPL